MSVHHEKIEVKKATELQKGKNVYKMSAEKRGYCIIFDNFTFTSLSNRYGCRTDANLLKQVFTQLNFIVEHHKNFLAKKISGYLEYYASKKELASHDALIVIILSHGFKDMVCGIDFKAGDEIKGAVSVQEIVEKFSSNKCPLLKNKPKIFFLNSTKGNSFEFTEFSFYNLSENFEYLIICR